MKMHLTNSAGNRITACRDNTVYINGDAHSTSLIIRPDSLITAWQPVGIDNITLAQLEAAAEYSSQGMIVLLGGGAKSPPIQPQWQAPFINKGATLDIMSLSAACRTYNFLNADGRLVMALLVLEANV
ncbi:MAG: hypothetical protein K0U19_00085 [Proteobacteria bacterium]|nr:hypothetical protein [Pseudomonadota bacterium]